MNKYMVSWKEYEECLTYDQSVSDVEQGEIVHYLIEAESRNDAGNLFLEAMYDQLVESGLQGMIRSDVETEFVEESIEGYYIDGIADENDSVSLAELSGTVKQEYEDELLSLGIVKTQIVMQDGKIRSIISKENMTERQKEAFMEDFLERFHFEYSRTLFEHLSDADIQKIWCQKMRYKVVVVPLSEKIGHKGMKESI